MQSRAFLLWIMLPGCGLVSGLDTLHLDDASVDARDAADDVGIVGVDAAATDAEAGPGIACGPQVCPTGMVCCVTQADSNGFTYTCAKDTCSGDLVLHCDDKSDCSGVVPICCLNTSGSQCTTVTSGACTILCSSSAQCGNQTQCVPFDAGYGLSLSRCQ